MFVYWHILCATARKSPEQMNSYYLLKVDSAACLQFAYSITLRSLHIRNVIYRLKVKGL